MALFDYKGLDRSGKQIKSTITVENIGQAKSKLRAQGIMLLDIKEQKSGARSRSQKYFGGGVSVVDLALMTRQLSTLIKAKIQIVEAFKALTEQTENIKLKVVLSEIQQKVNEGSSLAKAMSDYPKIFDMVYVNMVEAGEQSGTLEVVLQRLAEFTEAQMKLKSRIKAALTYPIIMLGIGILMFGVIFTFVIPKLAKVFESMKKDLPWTTELCISISDFTRDYWYMMIIGSVVAYIAIKKYVSTTKGEAAWHGLVLKLPVAGELVTMVNIGRFCSTLSTLLSSGVPILTAMRIVKNLVTNVHMQKTVEECQAQVQEGASMTTPLSQSGLFPPMVTHMITLGERSGELEPMLNIISENYDDQVENKLGGLTATLEPAMMVVMGLLVGFVVFSVVMPMMELNSVK